MSELTGDAIRALSEAMELVRELAKVQLDDEPQGHILENDEAVSALSGFVLDAREIVNAVDG